jgi:hypothetical protein
MSGYVFIFLCMIVTVFVYVCMRVLVEKYLFQNHSLGNSLNEPFFWLNVFLLQNHLFGKSLDKNNFVGNSFFGPDIHFFGNGSDEKNFGP